MVSHSQQPLHLHLLQPADNEVGSPPTQNLPKPDFHQAIGSLGQYPELMRRIGLTIDLEITLTGEIPSNGIIRVTPTPALQNCTALTPWTSYELDTNNKRFLPSSDSNSDVADGMLQLAANNTNNYEVVEMDIDSGALKTTDFAYNLSRIDPDILNTSMTPDSYGLPALRSGGFSIARTDRAVLLSNRLNDSSNFNDNISNNPQPSPDSNLKADFLVRGYRVDVWDSMTKKWHSLCLRNGSYNFLTSHIKKQFKDEGFISLSTSQVDENSDFHLPESLFRWTGWGLCVRRIGKTIGGKPAEGEVYDPNKPGSVVNDSKTDFNLEVEFNAVPRSLPRLRFGVGYQFRARAVDLAGNSVGIDDPIDNKFSIPTQPIKYVRFEPVPSPVLVLQHPLDDKSMPGESIDRIVIRSNYNTLIDEPSTRHIAPPKTSQHMAETHGMFDEPDGTMDTSIYEMLTKKDGSFEMENSKPVKPIPHPEAQLSLPYLPDPIASGATLYFHNFPGMPTRSFYKYPFSGNWPDKRPFVISLKEGFDMPVFAENNNERKLTISLPKAESIDVELSCYLGEEGLSKMAIWGLVESASSDIISPSDILSLKQLALDGRHWMLTPFRKVKLVHAVQQPLISPEFQKLTAHPRNLGETIVRITDQMPINGKSTDKLDIQATWQNIVDDWNIKNQLQRLINIKTGTATTPTEG